MILGRGSQFILPPERALRVLVVAPKAERVERVRKRHSISVGEAEELVRQSDADRRHFLTYHFHREPDDPNDYDLCVNTGLYSLDAAASLLIAAYRARFPWARPLPHVSHRVAERGGVAIGKATPLSSDGPAVGEKMSLPDKGKALRSRASSAPTMPVDLKK